MCNSLSLNVEVPAHQEHRDPTSSSAKKDVESDTSTCSYLSSSLKAKSLANDHDYNCDFIPPKKKKPNQNDLPEKAAAILPTGYSYKCVEYQEIPETIHDSFQVKFLIKNVTCPEDVAGWLETFTASSNIKYNQKCGGHAKTGKRVSFAQWYICQCKRKN